MIDLLESSRAKRLRAATHDQHEALDRSIMERASFEDLTGYGRFLRMQYRFHRDIAPLYADPSLAELLPGLAGRQRLGLVEADLDDMALDLPAQETLPVFDGAIDVPTALGWLYVAEGSNMGAALLRKAAARLGMSDTQGARHLAPAPEGPAAQWRGFTTALDAIALDEEEEARVVEGAKAAFARVQRHADSVFA